jgi:hypothetical protein
MTIQLSNLSNHHLKSFNVKKVFLLSIVMLTTLFSCKVENKMTQESDSIVITEQSDDDGRPTFNVKLPDGTVYEYFYAEEIAHSLITGTWQTDQDLRLAYASEYQVTLEPDSMMIYDWKRLVAAVPYSKTGVLDSVFMADNQ